MSGASVKDKTRIAKLRDPICERTPDQIDEYRELADGEGVTADEWVWMEEGTLDRKSGMFLCNGCYIRMGMPAGGPGEPRWTATVANVAALLGVEL